MCNELDLCSEHPGVTALWRSMSRHAFATSSAADSPPINAVCMCVCVCVCVCVRACVRACVFAWPCGRVCADTIYLVRCGVAAMVSSPSLPPPRKSGHSKATSRCGDGALRLTAVTCMTGRRASSVVAWREAMTAVWCETRVPADQAAPATFLAHRLCRGVLATRWPCAARRPGLSQAACSKGAVRASGTGASHQYHRPCPPHPLSGTLPCPERAQATI